MPRITPLGSPTHYPSSTLTKPKDYPGVFLLELHSRPDNRLTEEFIQKSLIAPLIDIEREFRASILGLLDTASNSSEGWMAPLTPGQYALVTCGPLDKNRFYSNGLDLTQALGSDYFFQHVLNRLYAKLLKFPIPTVAAINGHAFAGGFALVMAHDFRIMKDNEQKGRVTMAMNELEFGATIPAGLVAVSEAKMPTKSAMRDCFTLAHRFAVKECVEIGIVDGTAPEPELLPKSLSFAFDKSIKATTGVYGLIKEWIYRDAIAVLHGTDEQYVDIKSVHVNRLKQLGSQINGKSKL